MKRASVVSGALFGTFFAVEIVGSTACLPIPFGAVTGGLKQSVTVNSVPGVAKVTLDGKPMGVTPIRLSMGRWSTPRLRLELEGFEPYELQFKREVRGGVLAADLLLAVPGLVIDLATGALFRLTPEQVEASLGAVQKPDPAHQALEITVVLKAEPGWEKVGQLKRR